MARPNAASTSGRLEIAQKLLLAPFGLTESHLRRALGEITSHGADDADLYFSVISLGEILNGITVLPVSKRRDGLQEWLDGTLRPWFEGRILPVTAPIAERFVLSGEFRWEGNQIKIADGLIVATALYHGLTIVTRNVKDFSGLGAMVFNPW